MKIVFYLNSCCFDTDHYSIDHFCSMHAVRYITLSDVELLITKRNDAWFDCVFCSLYYLQFFDRERLLCRSIYKIMELNSNLQLEHILSVPELSKLAHF